jgi:hypothetical protein
MDFTHISNRRLQSIIDAERRILRLEYCIDEMERRIDLVARLGRGPAPTNWPLQTLQRMLTLERAHLQKLFDAQPNTPESSLGIVTEERTHRPLEGLERERGGSL